MIKLGHKNTIFASMIDKVELPESIYDKAIERYNDLGKWFDREDSSVVLNQPHIFPQGSFCLGTAIRPLNVQDEYDLDLSCKLKRGISSDNYTQQQLRDLVYKELEQYCKARCISNRIEKKHRCLRISYQDVIKFHMDIVPSIPANSAIQKVIQESMLKYGSDALLAHEISETSLLIPDDRHARFNSICDDWKISNPEGYAKWFDLKMKHDSRRELLEKVAQVDEIPIYKKKAPLQRVIQLLKRHRDIMFQDYTDSKPISIIITTLASHAYNGEQDLATALINILSRMDDYVGQVKPRVPNPVDPNEDFADKWHMDECSHLNLEDNFWFWLKQAKLDFAAFVSKTDTIFITELVEKKLSIKINGKVLSEQLNIRQQDVSTYKPTEHVIVQPPAKPWKQH